MVDLLNSMQGCNIVPILLYLDIQAILNRLAKKSFSNDASFRTAVHQEIASQVIGREVFNSFLSSFVAIRIATKTHRFAASGNGF